MTPQERARLEVDLGISGSVLMDKSSVHAALAEIDSLRARLESTMDAAEAEADARIEVQAKLTEAEAQLAAVLREHEDDGDPTIREGMTIHWCACGDPFPCPTRRAVEEKP